MFLLLFFALLVRLFLLPLPGFGIDINDWMAWANHLASVGPASFYNTIWCDYLPSYLYVLWFLAELHRFIPNLPYEILMKIPAVLADLGIGLFLYQIVKENRSSKLALLTASLFLFNPFTFFNSAIWGQIDSVFSLSLLVSIFFLLKKRTKLSFVLLGVSSLLKPQAIFFLPLLILWMIGKKATVGEILINLFAFAGAIFFVSWPFFPQNPLSGLIQLMLKSSNTYPYTSLFAANLWGFLGTWKPDNLSFLGLSYQFWGLFLLSTGLIFTYFLYWQKKDVRFFFFSAALIVLVFFMLPTRVHERWFYAFFPFFLITAALTNKRKIWFSYGIFSLIFFLNLYYVYTYYNQNFLKITQLTNFLGHNFKFLSLLSVVMFGFILAWGIKGLGKLEKIVEKKNVVRKGQDIREERPKNEKEVLWTRRELILISLVFFVSFLTRVIRLDIPQTYMFDEVYHAFTAVEMEKGNLAAWEWWNTPPKGFAYEWTHPPLAKEMMILGIKIFPRLHLPSAKADGGQGENPFAWRFPVALFGAGVIVLGYLLGRELFNRRVGLITAFLLNFDGLVFVQSRIGMNDTFFLFFMLLAFWLFLKDKWFGVGIALGLALASKWTAMYAIGILGGLFFFRAVANEFFRSTLSTLAKKSRYSTQSDLDQDEAVSCEATKIVGRRLLQGFFKFVLVFFLLPIAVYLLSYLPFFISGHTWQQFDGLQHQMWWYHTGLKATHPFTSAWYSWPFLFRPVWYYVDYGKETIANIYAMGNPAIWWFGLVAIGYTVVSSIKYLVLSIKRKYLIPDTFYLILIVVGYFGFFLPWALSPRIMFLYHYLPSVPFLCLALAYGLDKLWHHNKILVYWYLLVVLVVFLYFYPHLSALAVPKELNESYFWFPSWR